MTQIYDKHLKHITRLDTLLKLRFKRAVFFGYLSLVEFGLEEASSNEMRVQTHLLIILGEYLSLLELVFIICPRIFKQYWHFRKSEWRLWPLERLSWCSFK